MSEDKKAASLKEFVEDGGEKPRRGLEAIVRAGPRGIHKLLADKSVRPDALDIENFGDLVPPEESYLMTDYAILRTLDAHAPAPFDVADVLATLILDLQRKGIIG